MTNQAAQIIAFPFPKRDWETCDDPREALFQLKLEISQMLNEVAAGRYTLSETNRRGIGKVNALCIEFGLTPLSI